MEPLFLLIILAVATVLIVLMVGIGGFAKGGTFNLKHGNRMMRWRLIAQFVAVVLIMAYVYVSRS